MKKIVYATTNQGKFQEIKKYLTTSGYEVLSLADFPSFISADFDVAETGETFEENAMIKARAYGDKLGVMTISEDTGLEVEALDGRPGVYSKRYGKTDEQRNEKLLRELEGIPQKDRKARFVTVVALYDPGTQKVVSFKGVMLGEIAFESTGTDGFGYDPIFINEYGKTNAEISLEAKNKISSRIKAVEQVEKYLQKQS